MLHACSTLYCSIVSAWGHATRLCHGYVRQLGWQCALRCGGRQIGVAAHQAPQACLQSCAEAPQTILKPLRLVNLHTSAQSQLKRRLMEQQQQGGSTYTL